jgi:hypothetical protein
MVEPDFFDGGQIYHPELFDNCIPDYPIGISRVSSRRLLSSFYPFEYSDPTIEFPFRTIQLGERDREELPFGGVEKFGYLGDVNGVHKSSLLVRVRSIDLFIYSPSFMN